MTPLPRSTDDLRDLRAARWIRESRIEQFDNYGEASQREQQDRAIERYGLKDTCIEYKMAGSGLTIWRSADMQDMISAAHAGLFDVLVVGYSDRWQRNLRRTLAILEDDLHPNGVAVLMADRRILSSDPQDWDELVAEASAAERYSRRLAERIREGIAAKARRAYGDQHGTKPLGFRRTPEKPRNLEIDPDTIGQAVALFEKYATGRYTFDSLGADVGMAGARVREILSAPIFNGFYRRGKRSKEESRTPAPWRANPPVSDELWEQVQAVRAGNAHGGGPYRPDRIDPLGRLIYCECGRYLKANGTDGGGQPQRVHPDPCPANPRATYRSTTWLEPLAAQVTQIDLSDATIAAVVAALDGPAPHVDELALRRLERERRAAADAFSTGRITLDAFTSAVARLDERLAVLKSAPAPRHDTVTQDRAVAYLKDLRTLWKAADDSARAALLAAVYQQVVVRGPEFVAVHLTPEAMAHGLALALPERVFVARPAGIEPAT